MRTETETRTDQVISDFVADGFDVLARFKFNGDDYVVIAKDGAVTLAIIRCDVVFH